MPSGSSQLRVAFGRLPWSERTRLSTVLKREVVGGILLLLAATIALIWANTPWRNSYFDFGAITVGPHWFDLHLSLAQWAAEGLLAIFFFVAGLELKRELVVGSLRKPSDALLPVAAAVGGMVLPALLYLSLTWSYSSARNGWGIPIATDIAFALAVLALVGRGLPPALRAFLLTLAVVDDLVAIVIIAIFYSKTLEPKWLLAALLLVVCYVGLQRLRVRRAVIYVPLALALWGCVHASGVHATVAGVVLGLATRVVRDAGEERSPAERLEERIRPISAGIAVPIFAFFAAGVTVVGISISAVIADPVSRGIGLGLVVGKCLGIFLTTYVVVRFTRAKLGEGLNWLDIFGVSLIAGIGFTVALLIAQLSFALGTAQATDAKIAIFAGSLCAALLAATVLGRRARAYRVLALTEDIDRNGDGIGDVYQDGVDSAGVQDA